VCPEQNLHRAELVRLIQVALDRLPPKYGDVLEWKYVEGYSICEIAGKLKMGNEATQSLLARAKRAFSDVYGSLTGPAGSVSVGTTQI
jgi:RNA polymerase sigma-70 factor (ECF subfamily)